VTLTMQLQSRKGILERELGAALASLMCPEDEECSVQVTENENAGIAVALKLQKSRFVSERWKMNHDAEAGWYTYDTVFGNDSATSIVDELRRILNMPSLT
jgi:hypothetical protein